MRRSSNIFLIGSNTRPLYYLSSRKINCRVWFSRNYLTVVVILYECLYILCELRNGGATASTNTMIERYARIFSADKAFSHRNKLSTIVIIIILNNAIVICVGISRILPPGGAINIATDLLLLLRAVILLRS